MEKEYKCEFEAKLDLWGYEETHPCWICYQAGRDGQTKNCKKCHKDRCNNELCSYFGR